MKLQRSSSSFLPTVTSNWLVIRYSQCKSLQVWRYSCYTLLNLSNEEGAQREFPNAAAISHLLNPFITPYKYTAGKYYRVGVKTKYFGFQTFRIHKGLSGKQCLISEGSESLKTFLASVRLFYDYTQCRVKVAYIPESAAYQKGWGKPHRFFSARLHYHSILRSAWPL